MTSAMLVYLRLYVALKYLPCPGVAVLPSAVPVCMSRSHTYSSPVVVETSRDCVTCEDMCDGIRRTHATSAGSVRVGSRLQSTSPPPCVLRATRRMPAAAKGTAEEASNTRECSLYIHIHVTDVSTYIIKCNIHHYHTDLSTLLVRVRMTWLNPNFRSFSSRTCCLT